MIDKKATPTKLLWIDLEMTGLNVETDVILEIASVITDGNLNVIAQGPSFIINQPKEKLLAIGDKYEAQIAKARGEDKDYR